METLHRGYYKEISLWYILRIHLIPLIISVVHNITASCTLLNTTTASTNCKKHGHWPHEWLTKHFYLQHFIQNDVYKFAATEARVLLSMFPQGAVSNNEICKMKVDGSRKRREMKIRTNFATQDILRRRRRSLKNAFQELNYLNISQSLPLL